ncbi:MAG: biotin carboxylase N-terminal domain-containing protein [Xanthomonadales bacterium]|nr:biotin carboxylase N-terminal domain-containing protein [Xanthomonadales bacterium]
MFSRVLIANRGEIACRIIRTCRRLGIGTVAVYSAADRLAPHVAQADSAVEVGGPAPTDSYLRGDRIIQAALDTQCQAVHPGYGFLSENAGFARACAEAGLVFIGPSPDSMEMMGSKAEAKAAMDKAGVPVVPGYHGEDQENDILVAEADRIGFPIMVKAAAGGGGKGMRIVESPDALPGALDAARREASNAFGDDRLILERYVDHPRHLEVQVFGDRLGNMVHLYERDCSSQRRHQKVIEESPAPGLTAEQQQALCDAGVAAARSVNYLNAGTVEFIADPDGNFFFLEMNTRLQVEHPVTEAVTGQDLVEWQLRVAAGEPLPLAQDEIQLSGHAFEARLYAEDPAAGFLPSTGTLDWLAVPTQARFDSGVEQGGSVTVHYDPMIAKIICHGPDRNAALQRLRRALGETAVAGLRSNLGFLARLADSQRLRQARMDTGYLDRHLDELLQGHDQPSPDLIRAAAVVHLLEQEAKSELRQQDTADPYSPWAIADGWRPGHAGRRVVSLGYGAGHHRFDVLGHRGHYMIQSESGESQVSNARLEGNHLVWQDSQNSHRVGVLQHGAHLQIHDGHRVELYRTEDPFASGLTEEASDERLLAPMPGRIVALRCQAGDSVAEGQELVVMEAMKMELSLTAPRAAAVAEVNVRQDDFVEADTLLVQLDFDESESEQ